MLGEMWDQASHTAAKYVGLIILVYLSGLVFLLIHHIKQNSGGGKLTWFDIYLQLIDIARFFTSIFSSKETKENTKPQNATPEDLSKELEPIIAVGIAKGKVFELIAVL